MEIDFLQIVVPAISGLIVGFCIGWFWASKKCVSVSIVKDLLVLIMNFVRAVSDGKLTPDEKDILIHNVSLLIQDIRSSISGGTAAAGGE